MKDKKKAALLILAGKPEMEEKEESGPSGADMMKELAKALESKDYERAWSAFESAASACGYKEE